MTWRKGVVVARTEPNWYAVEPFSTPWVGTICLEDGTLVHFNRSECYRDTTSVSNTGVGATVWVCDSGGVSVIGDRHMAREARRSQR